MKVKLVTWPNWNRFMTGWNLSYQHPKRLNLFQMSITTARSWKYFSLYIPKTCRYLDGSLFPRRWLTNLSRSSIWKSLRHSPSIWILISARWSKKRGPTWLQSIRVKFTRWRRIYPLCILLLLPPFTLQSKQCRSRSQTPSANASNHLYRLCCWLNGWVNSHLRTWSS